MSEPPNPQRGRRLDPEEFAKEMAKHLAASSPKGNGSRPPRHRKRVSERDRSPLIGRLVSWTAIVGLCFGAGIGIAALVVWLAGASPGVAADETTTTVSITFPSEVATTLADTTTATPDLTSTPFGDTTTTSTTNTPATTAPPQATTTTRPPAATTTTATTTPTSTTPTSTTPTTPTTTLPPSVTVSSPGPDQEFIFPATVTLTFTCEGSTTEGGDIVACYATINATTGVEWSSGQSWEPAVGSHTIYFHATNAAGTTTTVVRTIHVVNP